MKRKKRWLRKECALQKLQNVRSEASRLPEILNNRPQEKEKTRSVSSVS